MKLNKLQQQMKIKDYIYIVYVVQSCLKEQFFSA